MYFIDLACFRWFRWFRWFRRFRRFRWFRLFRDFEMPQPAPFLLQWHSQGENDCTCEKLKSGQKLRGGGGGRGWVEVRCVNNYFHLFCLPIKVVVFPVA